jgi:hypothetical protein
MKTMNKDANTALMREVDQKINLSARHSNQLR